MLQQILKDMYIDPDVLEALNEEQKKILFLKMRQEQVRRWKEREESLEKEGASSVLGKPKPRKASTKNVSWLLGKDGDVHVCVIGESLGSTTSELIFSERGGRKVSGSFIRRHETGNLKSHLLNKMPSSEPFLKTKENIPAAQDDGIQLHFKGIPAHSNTAPGSLHSQEIPQDTKAYQAFSQHETNRDPQSSSIELEEENDSDTSPADPQDPELCYRPHPISRDSVKVRQEHVESQANNSDKSKDFKVIPAARKPVPESGREDGQAPPKGSFTRGRVAELAKSFNGLQVSSGKSSRAKPPVPTKPAHLQIASSSTFR
ncbi:SH2 domain-containing protein 4A-like [Lepisosteus oculatus]|uniref:Zgc:100829 n=1 Tax=Lepisosteus oculatus TaxID=7918 RepID=W5N4G6_LEPOC